MEPQLIEPNVLRKLYKKRLELNNKNFFTTTFTNIWLFIKKNWIGLAIVMFVISLMIYFYINKQKENTFNNIPQEVEEEPVELPKSGYEAEYYKMLPRVMPPPPEAYDEEEDEYDYDYQ